MHMINNTISNVKMYCRTYSVYLSCRASNEIIKYNTIEEALFSNNTSSILSLLKEFVISIFDILKQRNLVNLEMGIDKYLPVLCILISLQSWLYWPVRA